MGPNDIIRLVLVHRNATMASALTLLLEKSGECEVLAAVTRPQEALSAARKTSPQVVLLDPELPDVDLKGLVSEIAETVPGINVVALTGSDDPEYLRQAINAGMTAFLTTAAEPDELISKLRLAAQGHVLVSGRMVNDLSDLAQTNAVAVSQGGPADLTNREREVIALASQGTTNRQIAEELVVTENTVKIHLRNIFRKLDVRNRHQLTALVHRLGLNGREKRPRLS